MPVRIASKQDGFRRCGVAHSCKPVIWPDERFTSAQLKQLQAEPMLIVDLVSDTNTPPEQAKPTLADLIAAADLATLRLAQGAINDRLVDESDVPGLLALRTEVIDALDALGYSDPVDPASVASAGTDSEQPAPEPEKTPAAPEKPVKPASDNVKTPAKPGKNSGK